MSTISIKDYIENQDVKKLAEDIVLGPQAEVLTMIERFNDRWRTKLGITKKFRWKPGTHPEYKKKATELLHITNKSNSLARIHWRVADSRYYFERMGNQINDIEKKLYTLRGNDLMFQDNTEFVEKALEYFYKISEDSKDVWNISVREHDSYRSLEILTIVDAKIINVRLQEEIIQEIPVAPISLQFKIPFDILLNAHSRIVSGDKSRLRINVSVGGMILDNENQILHPYISGGGGWSNTRRPSTDYVHTCFGDLTSQIFHAIYTLDWENAEWLLNRWASNYTINVTNPLNNIKGSYHGKPSYLTEKYMDVVGHSVNDCAFPNIFRTELYDDEKIYCDKVDCLLKSECTFYRTEINIMLAEEDEASLYEIAELYQSKYSSEDVMPDTTMKYFRKLYALGVKYFGRHNNVTWKHVYESMYNSNSKINEFVDYHASTLREVAYRQGITYQNNSFTTDCMFPVISYWGLCDTSSKESIDKWAPYIRIGYDRKEEEKRINSIYCMMFDDLIEHLDNCDMMDLEPMFEYPYNHQPIPIKVQERQEPINTDWAEYLANSNLRSIGGQNE